MARVDRKRGEHGKDLLAKHGVQLCQLFLADLLPAHERDARLRERRHDLTVVDPDLAVDQALDPGADCLQLLLW